ncbi:hypothetical protein OESDEN_03876 [Oesophagostomum dentatum]|uniref:Uncharacterized protein n=1 Tax=Oesophagostomum dentatum TaxID=61180 RepID=A0A0B1TLB8_OESDE|nr:hypothetical protein OESDEN_03876 [Oesophagostomum dentatum]
MVLRNVLLHSSSIDEVIRRFPPATETDTIAHHTRTRAGGRSAAQIERLRLVNYFAEKDGLL